MLEVGAGVEVMVAVGLKAAGNERVILGRGRYVCVSTLIRRSASATCDTYVVPLSPAALGASEKKRTKLSGTNGDMAVVMLPGISEGNVRARIRYVGCMPLMCWLAGCQRYVSPPGDLD